MLLLERFTWSIRHDPKTEWRESLKSSLKQPFSVVRWKHFPLEILPYSLDLMLRYTSSTQICEAVVPDKCLLSSFYGTLMLPSNLPAAQHLDYTLFWTVYPAPMHMVSVRQSVTVFGDGIFVVWALGIYSLNKFLVHNTVLLSNSLMLIQ